MTRSRFHIDEGWFEVDVVDSIIEDGYLTFVLDESSIVFHHRHWRYWWSLVKLPVLLLLGRQSSLVKGGIRKTNN